MVGRSTVHPDQTVSVWGIELPIKMLLESALPISARGRGRGKCEKTPEADDGSTPIGFEIKTKLSAVSTEQSRGRSIFEFLTRPGHFRAPLARSGPGRDFHKGPGPFPAVFGGRGLCLIKFI